MRAEVKLDFGEASRGVRTRADVQVMLEAGADRIGTSSSATIPAAR